MSDRAVRSGALAQDPASIMQSHCCLIPGYASAMLPAINRGFRYHRVSRKMLTCADATPVSYHPT